ncbi:MAG TPA: SAM-dependent chlorinase/fluorinase [Pyrinomonadaceae bacterium]
MKERKPALPPGDSLHPLTLSSGIRDSFNPPVTLLTDFGTADYFIGAMKGVILSINPEARIVDVTHNVPPQDIEAAAFTLLAGYRSFPAGTVHVAVVDPGVGSGRRPVVIQAGNHCFVGPDNGIFSYVCDQETDIRAFHVSNDKYFRHPVSATFHGRDIFAPVAAVLSIGVEPSELGEEIEDTIRLESIHPERLKNGKVKGRLIHIDRFGNCITNISREDFTEAASLQIKSKTIKSFRRFFAEPGRDKLFGVWGSAGFLEIAANNASAAKLLNVQRGEPVVLTRHPQKTRKGS